MIFKPLLATDADLGKLRFPVLASAKLDGVRAVVRDGVVYSRSNKPIPNAYVQQKLGKFEHYDGELIVGYANSKTVYRDTVSHVMSHDKVGFDLAFHVFDHVQFLNRPYVERCTLIRKLGIVVRHEHCLVRSLPDLFELEEQILEQGYEGLILRDPEAPYKMGRSTVKEGILLKLKRMKTDEAEIIGYEERLRNDNPAETNELGRTKRSSHKENKTGRGDLGALIVRDLNTGVEFSVGTGFSDEERSEIWGAQSFYLGKIISYDHFPIGVKEKPRHPSYKGLRDRSDM